MGSITVTTTTNYRIAPNDALVTGQDIVQIVFSTSGLSAAQFGSSQFGGANISNSVQITGDSNQNGISVFVNAGSFSALDWSFVNWNSVQDIVEIFGTNFADTIFGSSQGDTIFGFAGADRLEGWDGDDTFGIGSGHVVAGETIDGGNGFDRIVLFTGATNADFRNATITGVERFSLSGGGSVASFSSDQIGGGGITAIQGDGGSDVSRIFVYGAANLSNLTFTQWGATDVLSIEATAASSTITGSSVADLITGGTGFDSLTGNGGADTIIGGDGSGAFRGGTGADSLVGGSSTDTFYYSSSNEIEAGEVLNGAGSVSDSIIILNDGFYDFSAATITGIEKLSFSSFLSSSATVRLSADQINVSAFFGGGDSIATIEGVQGKATRLESLNVTSLNWSLANFTNWTAGQDSIYLEARTSGGNIIGSGQDDSIAGLAGNDTLSGLTGNDTLAGGTGFDSLSGGSGADQFVFIRSQLFAGANDTITDFNPGESDVLVIKGGTLSELALTGSGLTRSFNISAGTNVLTMTQAGNVNVQWYATENATTLANGAVRNYDAAGFGEWAEYTQFYDSQNRFDYESGTYDGGWRAGGSWTTDVDQAGDQYFVSYRTEYNSAGQAYQQFGLTDDGRSWEFVIAANGVTTTQAWGDQNATRDWSGYIDFYDAFGRLDYEIGTYDAGWRAGGTWSYDQDQNNDSSFVDWYRNEYNAVGQLYQQFGYTDDGRAWELWYDNANVNTFQRWNDVANNYSFSYYTDTRGDYGNGLTWHRVGLNDNGSAIDQYF